MSAFNKAQEEYVLHLLSGLRARDEEIERLMQRVKEIESLKAQNERFFALKPGSLVVWYGDGETVKAIPLVCLFATRADAEATLDTSPQSML